MTLSVVMFNGSPRRNGNTAHCLNRIAKKLEARDVQSEIIHLPDTNIQPCTACMGCGKTGRCVQDDGLNELVDKMAAADGIIMGSPTWFGSVTGWVKNLIDRAGLVNRRNDKLIYRKAGAAVIAVRRGGAVQVYNEIMSFFALNHFYMVGSSYWNFAIGLKPGDVEDDAEGMQTMDDIADNMAHLLNALKGAETQ